LMFRNERRLYKRKCDATWESIISNYSPNTSVNVFAVQYWRSKQWNAPIIQYDRKKNILDHMKTLIWNSPAMSLTNDYTTLENSEYSNYLKNAKDCYLVFWWIDCDSCMYSSTCYQSQDCVDCMKSYDCSFCFDCIACFNCSNMQHSTECYDCSNSSYLDQCSNCHNCFNCSNLSDKRYCIANEQYWVEEYYLMLKEHTDWVIWKYMPAVRSTQCESVFWSGLKNCSRCAFCYDCNDIENWKYLYWVVATNDSMDVTIWWSNNALIYESLEIWEWNYDLLFSITCRNNCYDLIYCQLCESCKDCFWCIWLSNAQYCIFNK
jgi:hypothetical protein